MRGRILSHRKVSDTESHPFIGFCQMEGNRIVNAGSDSRLIQFLLQLNAVGNLDDIKMEH